MSFLSLFSFSFLCVGTPCMRGMLARCVCTACKCDCILLPALLPIEKSNRRLEPPGRISLFPRPAVCVLKPNSLALRAGVRKLCRRPGRFFSFCGPGVCVRKPILLTLRTGVRKPGRPPGRIFHFPRPAVCVPKPNSLAFQGVVRKPGRPPGRIFLFSRPAVCVPKPNSLAFQGVVRKPGRPPGRLSHFPRAPHPNNEETEGARLRFLFFPIIPGCGRMLPAGRSELPCTRHRSRCRCSPLPLHWHRS